MLRNYDFGFGTYMFGGVLSTSLCVHVPLWSRGKFNEYPRGGVLNEMSNLVTMSTLSTPLCIFKLGAYVDFQFLGRSQCRDKLEITKIYL